MMGEGLVEVVDAHGATDGLHGLLADTAGFGGAALKDGTHLGQTLLPLGTRITLRPRDLPLPLLPLRLLQCSRLCSNEPLTMFTAVLQ